MESFPCIVCHKNVAKNHKSIQCDKCNCWVHIKCNNISSKQYSDLISDPQTWFCIICDPQPSSIKTLNLNVSTNSPNLNYLFKCLNKVNNSVLDCKYYNVDDFNALDLNLNPLNFLHLNISSLSFHIDELKSLISSFKFPPCVIAVSETRLKQHVSPISNVEIENYVIEHTPTESSCGGALLYISSTSIYNKRDDLLLYKAHQLESVFIEIIDPNGKNTIVGCIYRHPCMSIHDFNKNFLLNLLEKLTKENKNVMLMGDFNIFLIMKTRLKYYFSLIICVQMLFFPYISLPTRVNVNSKTLIDNIFINFHSNNIISGNLIISDHLAQFVQIPSFHSTYTTENIYRRCFQRFNNDAFLDDVKSIPWSQLIKEEDDPNRSVKLFMQNFENILNIHAPLKPLTKRQIKSKSKPWITQGILKSIKIKDKLYRKFLNHSSTIIKERTFNLFKAYRNKISNLLKISKKNFYSNFFQNNLHNMKNTWKGIREIININNSFTKKQSINLMINNN
ncbi:uncharacterized protein LOC136087146 [Hydra vulgaris]|uniref:Uncharacterized protein LOC136087146 n=1 Tax=Hydra vulgaris TaxID=6087 RepID=A0ABM4CUW8_HYDVU